MTRFAIPEGLLEAPRLRRAAAGLAALCALVILIACLLPGEELPATKLSDKTEHFIAYCGLTVPLGIALGRGRIGWALLMAALYGLIVEGLQAIVPTGRSASWLDALANAAGAGLGGLMLVLVFAAVRSERA